VEKQIGETGNGDTKAGTRVEASRAWISRATSGRKSKENWTLPLQTRVKPRGENGGKTGTSHSFTYFQENYRSWVLGCRLKILQPGTCIRK
jgi:hypothetical protein